MPEKPAKWYDEHYKIFQKPRPEMTLIFDRTVEMLKELEIKSVLDIGCGLGVLMNMCNLNDILCKGFDFSVVAIEYCKAHYSHSEFWVGDVRHSVNYLNQYDAYLAIELLEHVKEDFKIIKNLKQKIPFIFSVPEFMGGKTSHVRRFRSDSEIIKRYGKILNIKSIETFGKRRLVLSEAR